MSTGDNIRIYGIREARTIPIRYIGQTKLPLGRRLTLHKYQSTNACKKTAIGKWIRSKKSKDIQIEIVLLRDKAIWNDDEIETIARYRRAGRKLLNLTSGGCGHFGTKLSEETKRKISIALKGKKKSKEHAANISKGKKGYNPTTETREKMRQAQLGKIPANKGSKLTREDREKISVLRGGKPIRVTDKLTGENIGVWQSVSLCAEDLKIHRNAINNVLANRAKSVGSYFVERAGGVI